MNENSGAAATDLNPTESLIWLAASLGRCHKEILLALLSMADKDGRVTPDSTGSIYQHAALHAHRSPGYANRVINELVWYGLLKAEKKNVVLAQGRKRLVESYQIVGFPHYRDSQVQCVLNAEQISGKSMRSLDPDWIERLQAIS